MPSVKKVNGLSLTAKLIRESLLDELSETDTFSITNEDNENVLSAFSSGLKFGLEIAQTGNAVSIKNGRLDSIIKSDNLKGATKENKKIILRNLVDDFQKVLNNLIIYFPQEAEKMQNAIEILKIEIERN